jgi:proteic killer suppression protein
MIRSYRAGNTERFAVGEKIRQWEPFRRQAEKRLRILDAAVSLADLAALNSNRLEALKGDRKGQHSIRINDQWRICFQWPKDAPGPSNVEIVDYH